jgi:signal peptidase
MPHVVKKNRGVVAACVTGAMTAAVVAWQKGYRVYVVHTGSMTPTLRPGDAVLDGPPPASLAVGDVITFGVRSAPDSVVTHRVNAIDADGIKTKGDANPAADLWTVKPADVVGTKVATLPYTGYVLVYLQHPKGVTSVITTILALILLWQLFFPPSKTSDGEERSGASPPSRRRHARRTDRDNRADDTSSRSPSPAARGLGDFPLPVGIPNDRYPPMLPSRSTWFPS